MSETTLLDLNDDCMFAIIQHLDYTDDPDAVTTRENCKDKMALSSTCSFLRSFVLETDGCSSYWKKLKYCGDRMESFFCFLGKVKDWVEELDAQCWSFMRRTDIQCRNRSDDGTALSNICITFQNVSTLSVGELTADALLPKFPSLRNFKGWLNFELPAHHYVHCWPMLEEIDFPSTSVSNRFVGSLRTFLAAHARLLSVTLPHISPNEPVLVPWLSTPGSASRLTTLDVGNYHGLPDLEVTHGIALCRNLESLLLDFGNLTNAALPHLGRLAKLHTLNALVWRDLVSSLGLQNFFETALFDLRVLRLHLVNNAPNDGVVKSVICNNLNLEILGVYGSGSADVFQDVSSLHQLRELTWHNSRSLSSGFLPLLDPKLLPNLALVRIDGREENDSDEQSQFEARFPKCKLNVSLAWF